MEIWIDTTDLTEIETALQTGVVDGITMDWKLIPPKFVINPRPFAKEVLALIKRHKPDTHLDVGGVFFKKPNQTLGFARMIEETFNYKHLTVQIPIGFYELAVIRELAQNKMSVNCVACMDVNQGILAAKAGAKYVSFFWNYIRDGIKEKETEIIDSSTESEKKFEFQKEIDKINEKRSMDGNDFNPEFVVGTFFQLSEHHKWPIKTIAHSIEGLIDVRDAALVRANIIVLPLSLLKNMPEHFMTEMVIEATRD